MKREGKKKGKKVFWISFSLLAVLIIAAVLLRPMVLKWSYPLKYEEQVEKYAAEYGLDDMLVQLGVLQTGLGLTTFSDAFTFALLIVILIAKPTGLFGEKATDKV